jgi:hypothetical protein
MSFKNKVEHYVECEVCGEKYEGREAISAWITTTWVLDSQGREEGIDHCKLHGLPGIEDEF